MESEQVIEIVGSEKRAAPKRKPRLVEVKIIKIKGGTALLEWREAGEPKRGYVPEAVIEAGKVNEEELEAAAPYGLAWEAYIPRADASTVLARTLRDANIWTAEDLLRGDPRAPFRQYAESLYGQFIRKVKELQNG